MPTTSGTCVDAFKCVDGCRQTSRALCLGLVGAIGAGVTCESVGSGSCTCVSGVCTLDALHVSAARSILSADFFASPGVGTGVEQMSAALPDFLAGVSMQLLTRGGRGGGTGACKEGVIKGRSRCTMGTGGGGSSGGGSETGIGGMVSHPIRLSISKARPLGV